jgi:hypothetical protein
MSVSVLKINENNIISLFNLLMEIDLFGTCQINFNLVINT